MNDALLIVPTGMTEADTVKSSRDANFFSNIAEYNTEQSISDPCKERHDQGVISRDLFLCNHSKIMATDTDHATPNHPCIQQSWLGSQCVDQFLGEKEVMSLVTAVVESISDISACRSSLHVNLMY